MNAAAARVLLFKMDYPKYQNMWAPGIIPQGPGKPNSRVYWSGSDSEENFKKNPKPGYDEKSIIYSYNSHGFRSEEFDFNTDKKNILAVGCSFTEGIGLRLEDTWVHKVSKHFPNHKCHNFGYNGRGAEWVARSLYNVVPVARPEIVFIFWPPMPRVEFWIPAADHACAPISLTSHCQGALQYKYAFDDANLFQIKKRCELMVDELQYRYQFVKIDLHFEETDSEIIQLPFTEDFARDNHWSPSMHTYIAKKFINLYEFIQSQK